MGPGRFNHMEKAFKALLQAKNLWNLLHHSSAKLTEVCTVQKYEKNPEYYRQHNEASAARPPSQIPLQRRKLKIQFGTNQGYSQVSGAADVIANVPAP